MVFIKLCHLTQEKVSLPNQFYYLIASKNLTKSCWHWLWFFTNFRPLAWKCLFWAKKTKCPGINAHICTHLQSHFMNIFIEHVTPLPCFSGQISKTFCHNLKKKQPVLPIFFVSVPCFPRKVINFSQKIDKSCFFKPYFQNFLPQFEKKQPVLPTILF